MCALRWALGALMTSLALGRWLGQASLTHYPSFIPPWALHVGCPAAGLDPSQGHPRSVGWW